MNLVGWRVFHFDDRQVSVRVRANHSTMRFKSRRKIHLYFTAAFNYMLVGYYMPFTIKYKPGSLGCAGFNGHDAW
jgi:hypothetical protein